MAEIKFHANKDGLGADPPAESDVTLIRHDKGSGLGFFGDGFGISVPVHSWQDSTFVTNHDGTDNDIKCSNTKYYTDDDTIFNGSGIRHDGVAVTDNTSGTPNRYAPLNIRFTHDEKVSVKSCRLRIFDRKDIAKQASGVTVNAIEFRHPHYKEGLNENSGVLSLRGQPGEPGLGAELANGETNFGWVNFEENGNTGPLVELVCTPSPGLSGLNTNGDEQLPPTLPGENIQWLTSEGTLHQSKQHDWYIGLTASPDSIGSKTDFGLYFTLEYF